MSRKHLRSSRRNSRCSRKRGNIHRDTRTPGHSRRALLPLARRGGAGVDPECWRGRYRFFGKHRQVGGTRMDGAHLGWVRSQRRDRGSGRAGPGDIAEPPRQEQHIRGVTGTPGHTCRALVLLASAHEHLDAQSPPGTGWDDREGQGTFLHPHNPKSWSLEGGALQPLSSCWRQLPASEGTFQKVLTGTGGQFQVMEEPTRR